jgi:fumarate hydratase class II
MATVTDTRGAVPIGTGATGTRLESDSMGPIEVPAEHYWGAQTQRSLIHFSIGDDRMPKAVYHGYGYVKKAAALVNADADRLDRTLADAIVTAADEVIAGKLDTEFPLYVWQTGSGTQSNMNVNEVIGNRASQLLGGELGSKHPAHPNDHVNMGQSSNDTFPTAMHIATLLKIGGHTLPRVGDLIDAIWAKAVDWVDVVKIGRTHLQDATPLTVRQEWSGWATQLRDARRRLDHRRLLPHPVPAAHRRRTRRPQQGRTHRVAHRPAGTPLRARTGRPWPLTS